MIDTRWQQRFENFDKAFQHFDELVKKDKLSWIEETALIKVFEIIFELSWKVLKDYIAEQGIIVKSPREAIKQAYQMDLITDGDVWLDALEKRNMMVHRYDEEYAKIVTSLIQQRYSGLFYSLHSTFVSLSRND